MYFYIHITFSLSSYSEVSLYDHLLTHFFSFISCLPHHLFPILVSLSTYHNTPPPPPPPPPHTHIHHLYYTPSISHIYLT